MNYQIYGTLNKESMHPSISSEQAMNLIVGQAKQLVNSAIEVKGNDKPPFLPAIYAKIKGIKSIIRADLGKTSGLLLRFSDGPVIKVNQKQSLVRQNFSCAHEIGHLLFSELNLEKYVNNIEYRTFDPQVKSKIRTDARERLCDAVATELLMPESIFQKYLVNFGISISVVERMADIFQVSLRAAVRRIVEVSVDPCISLVWEPTKKGNDLKLVQCSGPDKTVIYTPINTKVKKPSLLHKAIEQHTRVKGNYKFKIGTQDKILSMESKGFGYKDFKCVVSLAMLNG